MLTGELISQHSADSDYRKGIVGKFCPNAVDAAPNACRRQFVARVMNMKRALVLMREA